MVRLSTFALALGALSGIVGASPTTSVADNKAAYTRYALVYFTGEYLSNGEQIYFAVSKTNSPASWNLVRGGQPVLTSTLGDKGVRDPFIIRDPKNSSKVYIIATDLKMYNSGMSWDQASRIGSRYLSVWESSDGMKTWSAQRLVQVSPPEAGMSWAPEVTYDPTQKNFIVYWASKLYASTDTNHTGTSYARILYSRTTDFKKFTPAKIWIDPGRDIIDTTVQWDAASGYYHRFSKTNGKILQEKSKTFFGNWTVVSDGIGQAQFGDVEGPLIFPDNTQSGLYHLFVDDTNPRGYQPYQSTNINGGVWTDSVNYSLPTNPRHGTVLPITEAEAAILSAL